MAPEVVLVYQRQVEMESNGVVVRPIKWASCQLAASESHCKRCGATFLSVAPTGRIDGGGVGMKVRVMPIGGGGGGPRTLLLEALASDLISFHRATCASFLSRSIGRQRHLRARRRWSRFTDETDAESSRHDPRLFCDDHRRRIRWPEDATERWSCAVGLATPFIHFGPLFSCSLIVGGFESATTPVGILLVCPQPPPPSAY